MGSRRIIVQLQKTLNAEAEKYDKEFQGVKICVQ